jgi:outer membrane receptor for ferrienterochelin and colicin
MPRAVLILVCLLSTASEALADSKAEARRYFLHGMELIDRGQYREGIAELEKAYEIRPHRNVLFNIARAYASLNSYDEAIEYFERYQATNPPDGDRVQSTLDELKLRQNLRRLVDRGMSAIKRKRYEEGLGYLRQAYEQRPHPNILFNMGRAFEEMGETERAIETYQEYLASSPKDASKVEGRIRRLKRRSEDRAHPPPPVVKKKPPPDKKKPPPIEQPPPGQKLDDDQLDRLAALLIDKMKAEGVIPPPPPPPPPPVEEPEEPKLADTTPETGAVAGTSTLAIVGADVQLEAKSGEAYEPVVVTASRRAENPLVSPAAVTILNEEDIRLSGARTLPDLLRRVPGVDVMQMSYSDYNVAVRGFNRRVANKVLVLVDGRTVYQDFLGGMLWRGLMIGLDDIERIEVVRGPGSAIYGAYAYTGMVNIITKRPEELKGSVATVAGGNGGRIEAAYQYGERRGPVGFRISGGYDRADKYELEFDPDRVDFTTNSVDPEKSLEMLRVDGEAEYNLDGDLGRIYVGGGARTGFNELQGVSALRNQAVDSQEYNARVGYASDLLAVRAFWNRIDAESSPQFFRVGLPDLGSNVVSDLLSFEPVFRPEFELLGKHQLVLGGEYRFKHIEWNYLIGPQTENHFALFVQESWTPIEFFSVILSARLDLHPLIGPLFSPRGALIFKLSDEQAIRLSAGSAFRQPTLSENYLNLSASSPVAGVAVTLVGSEELDPERIETVDLGYRWTPEFGDFELVGYFNRISNLIGPGPLVPTGPEESFRDDLGAYVGAKSFYFNDPRHFLAFGAEVAAKIYPIDGLDVGVSYAFQYIFDQDTGERFTDSPLHKVTGWGILRTKFGLDVGASVHFVSEQDWVEPAFNPDDPSQLVECPVNTDCHVDHAVVVIGRIGYRLFDDRLELGVAGTNLTDFGNNRHREHPFANRVEARVVGTVTGRF